MPCSESRRARVWSSPWQSNPGVSGRGSSRTDRLRPSPQARKLLEDAAEGVNPFEGFTPRLADGESLEFGTPEFEAMEAEGLRAAAKTAFVLVRPLWSLKN